jgi:4-carboxymuconolactone decarboxylase
VKLENTMTISGAAQASHDELFPDGGWTMRFTDPELSEVFENFAFGEVAQHGTLDTRIRLMVQLASMVASQAQGQFRVMLGAALAVGVTPVEAKEVVYQAVPYVGMARVYDFLQIVNEVLTERGVDVPVEGQSTTDTQTRAADGLAIQKAVIGAEIIDNLYATASDDTIHFQRYLSANCFGDYVTRRGLDLKTRELLTFAMLVSLGGCEPQVASHVAGNLNVGNDRTDLLNVLTQLLPFIGYPRTLNGLRVLNEAAPAV